MQSFSIRFISFIKKQFTLDTNSNNPLPLAYERMMMDILKIM